MRKKKLENCERNVKDEQQYSSGTSTFILPVSDHEKCGFALRCPWWSLALYRSSSNRAWMLDQSCWTVSCQDKRWIVTQVWLRFKLCSELHAPTDRPKTDALLARASTMVSSVWYNDGLTLHPWFSSCAHSVMVPCALKRPLRRRRTVSEVFAEAQNEGHSWSTCLRSRLSAPKKKNPTVEASLLLLLLLIYVLQGWPDSKANIKVSPWILLLTLIRKNIYL